MAFKDTDKILVHRDGVDYQADLGPLMGGGGGLDDILNAPIDKTTKYTIWEDIRGVYQPMELIEGDGGTGSKFKAKYEKNKTDRTTVDGSVQYANSYDPTKTYASINMAMVNDFTIRAVAADGSVNNSDGDVYEGTNVESTALGGSRFHSHYILQEVNNGGFAPSIWNGYREYILELSFTDIYGDKIELSIQCMNFAYVSMRREDIDLREMEELDRVLKQKKAAAKNKRGAN